MKPFRLSLNVRAWFAAALMTALLSCGGGDSGGDGFSNAFPENNVPSTTQASVLQLTDAFAATLSGGQQVPQVASSARGSGTVVVNPVSLDMIATLTTSGITATAVHIQQAATGANGPIVFVLTETSPGSGIWTLKTRLTGAQFNMMQLGGFYFNVRSTTFADGEIRGQITSQQTSGAISGGTGLNTVITPLTAFVSSLRGLHEVPPVTSGAQGAGSLLTTISSREVIASLVTNGISGTAATIHQGALGINGPAIISLTETSGGSGIWTTRATLTDPQYNALQAGNLYFNVSSAAFPNGEIRGQILLQRQTLANSIGPPPDATGSGVGVGVGVGAGSGTGTSGSGAVFGVGF